MIAARKGCFALIYPGAVSFFLFFSVEGWIRDGRGDGL